ncbi:MAG: nucleotide sugar dehydrogenase, partial [Planctomycetes bacterium]|nr:nucleotide sugar dehydrogenase [Planctomycetota bacterium]
MTKRKLSIKDRVPNVGIIGLGYVGLPLSREFCLGGAQVTGFDVNTSRVAKLNSGKSPIKNIPHSEIRQLIRSKKFRATDSMTRLAKMDAIIICVP